MEPFFTSLRRFPLYAGLPEMRVFWILLPLIASGAGVNIALLPFPLSLVPLGIFFLIALGVFWSSLRAAAVTFGTIVERNQLRSMIYSMSDALIAYDENFRIGYYNAAAEELFRIPAGEATGRVMQPQDVQSPATQLLAQVIFPSLAPGLVTRSRSGQYPQVSDLAFADPELELRIITTPITDPDGRVIGFMKIIRNRTREVSLVKSKEEFFTIASHQLRTPITELNWALEAIGKDEKLASDTKNLVVHAKESAEKLLVLVEDLLNTSQMEEGRFGYNFQPIDLLAFLEDPLREGLAQAEHTGLKLYFDRPKEPVPPVTVDPPRLRMVLMNLLDNAIRYNVQGGQVVVSVRKSETGPFVEVSVKDTGIGIPADEIGRIFTKFYRSSNALKFQTEGSGLGLYIARNIIHAHGGQLRGESELNRGSTFTFTLPTDPTLIPPKEIPIE